MDWNIVSAIGTILAAVVGVIGIWINIWEKQRKLNVKIDFVPNAIIYISNNSQRTVAITKIIYSIDNHMFFVEHLAGLEELYLMPATTHSYKINKQNVHNAYIQHQMDLLGCRHKQIVITLYDNYDRKHQIKSNYSIDCFIE